MLKFHYNGIKGSDGKLQKCMYSEGMLIGFPAGTLTIYGKGYSGFSAEVAEQFEVHNGTDTQTDYFESDRIRVLPNHPLYSEVKAACKAWDDHNDRRYLKAQARRAQATA